MWTFVRYVSRSFFFRAAGIDTSEQLFFMRELKYFSIPRTCNQFSRASEFYQERRYDYGDFKPILSLRVLDMSRGVVVSND